jgi:two-component system chemotaxis response regulator CheB
MDRPIRAVIADDSALMRKKLREILEADPAIRVVACARDGQDAVAAVKEHDPDVVTLDINMPVMDGVSALQVIMNESPRPVVMVSSLTQEGALATFECLELGAVDFVGKLSGTISVDIEKQAEEIVAKVKGAARARLHRRARPRVSAGAARPAPPKTPPAAPGAVATRLVAVGVSTGGPKTLLEILPLLPVDLPAAVVVVQHMPESFTASLARSMDNASKIPIKEAEAGDVLRNGHGYVARGGRHLVFARARLGEGVMVRYQNYPTDLLHMPSVDVMMASAVEAFAPRLVGVLLTGMGADGASGMVKIRKAGGATIAEHESTCVVFGMPAEAIARGGADHVLPCDLIASRIVSLVRHLN